MQRIEQFIIYTVLALVSFSFFAFALSYTAPFSDVSIVENSSYIVNLTEHFSGAMRYYATNPEDLLYCSFDNESLTCDTGETAASSGVSFETGKTGTGVYFNDTDTLTYPIDGNINTSHGTVSLWFKPTWNGYPNFLTYLFATGTLDKSPLVINIQNSTSELCFYSYTNRYTYWCYGYGYNWQASTWYHAAISWNKTIGNCSENINGEFVKIYLNGILVDQEVGTCLGFAPSTASDIIRIGQYDNSGNFQARAVIDEVRVTDQIVSADEISKIFSNGRRFPYFDVSIDQASGIATLTPSPSFSGDSNKFAFVASNGTNIEISNMLLINVTANKFPYFSFLFPASNLTINENENLTLQATAVDPESESIAYSWYQDGNPVSSTENYTLAANYSSAGSALITVKASDGS
ncbi:MAG: LamG-like jellyroll fold domain-containing protein, partial [Candidatus Micrarchaeota archaeon]